MFIVNVNTIVPLGHSLLGDVSCKDQDWAQTPTQSVESWDQSWTFAKG